ncbi:MAG: TetR family transcriptional regulator [Rhodobacteraceae bacterium PARR1]|nr:MAG: TetR family transcriptional regulator [Rhodobacteraceae bacterium PARR1]
MTGLREQHKADRTRRILQAASEMFRDQGYDAVRIEDIAQRAEVSAGTCYNYFSTKGDILLAIVSMEVEEVVAAGQAVIDAPPETTIDALDRLIRLYYDHSLHYLSKALWRRAMSLSIAAPETPFSQRYTALDAMLARQVSDLIAALQQRGIVRGDADAALLGQMIFHDLNQRFVAFVTDEGMPLTDLHKNSLAATQSWALMLEPRDAPKAPSRT